MKDRVDRGKIDLEIESRRLYDGDEVTVRADPRIYYAHADGSIIFPDDGGVETPMFAYE